MAAHHLEVGPSLTSSELPWLDTDSVCVLGEGSTGAEGGCTRQKGRGKSELLMFWHRSRCTSIHQNSCEVHRAENSESAPTYPSPGPKAGHMCGVKAQGEQGQTGAGSSHTASCGPFIAWKGKLRPWGCLGPHKQSGADLGLDPSSDSRWRFVPLHLGRDPVFRRGRQ